LVITPICFILIDPDWWEFIRRDGEGRTLGMMCCDLIRVICPSDELNPK